jgi:hypothetical protein
MPLSAHPSIRGRLTTLQQFFLGIGAFVASFVGYGLTKNYPVSQSSNLSGNKSS